MFLAKSYPEILDIFIDIIDISCNKTDLLLFYRDYITIPPFALKNEDSFTIFSYPIQLPVHK